jgi:hypothetical protein
MVEGLIEERLTSAAGPLEIEMSRLRVVRHRCHDYLKVRALV